MTERPEESLRPLTLIAAHSRNRVIGDRGGIPWRSREDFAHFRSATLGATLIMGRLTHESIGRPLPERRTIVITRNPDWRAEGVEVAHSLQEARALSAAHPFGEEDFVAGGEQIYRLALPVADRQILTTVDLEVGGDAFYPPFDEADWQEVRRISRPENDPPLEWVWWQRVHPGE